MGFREQPSRVGNFGFRDELDVRSIWQNGCEACEGDRAHWALSSASRSLESERLKNLELQSDVDVD